MTEAKALRVLLVEDEALIAMMAEDMLEGMGCGPVTIATTLADALAAVSSGTFDVAMLDVNLNGERSLAVADAARARGLPYLFTTGYGAEGLNDAHRGVPVLAKPYSLADLQRTVFGCAAQGTIATSPE